MAEQQVHPLESVAASVAGKVHEDEGLLVTTGQYSPDGTERVAVIGIDNMVPREIWHGFVARDDLEPLRDRLGQQGHRVWPGENDSMYATRWELAWTSAPAPFLFFDRRGLRCSVEERALWLYQQGGAAPRSLPVSSARRAFSWVSLDWEQRGVSVELGDEEIVVAQQRDSMVGIDPAYDWFNLIFDAAWANGLARSLATALGVPFESFEAGTPSSPL